MPIMYIAGPLLNGHKLTYEQAMENWKKTVLIAYKVAQKGWTVEIPHHSLFMWDFLKDELGIDLPHDFWMQQDSGKIKVCQALFFVGHSRGADMELEYALNNDMKVYYNVDEVPNVPVERCLLEEPTYNKPYEVPEEESNVQE